MSFCVIVIESVFFYSNLQHSIEKMWLTLDQLFGLSDNLLHYLYSSHSVGSCDHCIHKIYLLLQEWGIFCSKRSFSVME